MWKNILLLLVSLTLVSVLLEAAVRFTYPANLRVERNDTAYFREGIGMLKTPGQVARNIQACFEVPEIRFNSLGFRDNELPANAALEVGILGDSAMEAVQIPEGEYTAALLESMLSKPVMNTGIGGASTVKELQIYRRLMSPHKPKVVLLFFTLGNDVLDNDCRTKDTATRVLGEPPFTGSCGTIETGAVRYRVPSLPPGSAATATEGVKQPSSSGLVGWLRTDCRSCRMINDILKGTLGVTLSPTTQSEADAYRAGLNLYRPIDALDADDRAAWQQAWSVTEGVLVELRDAVAADGGRLVVVSLPDNMQVSRDWRKEFKTHFGFDAKSDMDPARPGATLAEVLERNRVPLLRLDSVFLAYRDRYELGFPFFSYACDGHWNPLGHFLAASWISEVLVREKFVAMPAPDEFAAARERERERTPAAILGEGAYRSIYHGGIFRHRSDLQGYRPQ